MSRPSAISMRSLSSIWIPYDWGGQTGHAVHSLPLTELGCVVRLSPCPTCLTATTQPPPVHLGDPSVVLFEVM